MSIRRRRTAAAAAVVWLTALTAAPARAVMHTPDPLGCSASASVQNGRSKSVFVDAADGEVRLPRQGDVYWTGSVAKPAHKEAGSVSLRLGFWRVPLGRWGTSANPTNQVMRQGATVVPTFVRYLPPGRYRVEGEDRAAEGACRGAVTVVLAGSGATTLAALGGLLLCGALAFGLVRCGRRRPGHARGRPVRGAFLGAILGTAVAGVLLTAFLVPSDSALVGALPLALLVGGIVLGAVAPFGRPQPAQPEA